MQIERFKSSCSLPGPLKCVYLKSWQVSERCHFAEAMCAPPSSQWLNAQAERAGTVLVDPKECCVFAANALTCRERSWTNLMSRLTGHWAHPGEQSPRVCLWLYRTHDWINPHELLPLFSEPYWKRADGCTEENDAPEETEEAKPYGAGINSAWSKCK